MWETTKGCVMEAVQLAISQYSVATQDYLNKHGGIADLVKFRGNNCYATDK